jgi:shikimate dehydrogenase
MHNTALKEMGLPYRYEAEAVSPDELAGAVGRFKSKGVVGFNVTIPHKETIIPLLDKVEEEAKRLGAVNTVVLRDEFYIGMNTDGIGFTSSLQEDAGCDPSGKHFVVLGAGGSSRAVAAHIALAGASEVVIANRTFSRAENLATDLAEVVGRGCFRPLPLEGEETKNAVQRAQCLVNTTSVGMAGDPNLPVPEQWIMPHLLVCDIIYRPLVTPLLRAASARGASTLDGLGMLIYQGAEAFRLWTGEEMPVEMVRRALTAVLKAEGS